jgi:2-dehydro-3-deoxyphosphogluconate aldolase / (4S)-4-hydroxy-2-oxoglutarate aldolase
MKFLNELPIIGIIRGADTKAVESAVDAAYQAGLRTLEITLNCAEAYNQIAMIRKKHRNKIELGAGTVLARDAANKAIAAGAEFIVTPAFIPEVIEFCRNQNIHVFPGAMTPTEILSAHQAGAEMIKVFPASALGPGYIKNLKGPFPEIKLIPTGGVTVESVSEYFKAGASAVGVGGEIFRREWLSKGDWASIEKTAKAYVKAVKESK